MWTSPPFLYTPSASVAAILAAYLVALASLGLSELRGVHLPYSKFWHVAAVAAGGRGIMQWLLGAGPRLPSRGGMLVAYAPALAAVLASFAVPGAMQRTRARLLSAALAVHLISSNEFSSGRMPLATALIITCYYLFNGVTMIHVQHLSDGLPDHPVDLLYPGVVVLAVGVSGNFYHHCLLSKLRADSESGDNKGYEIPRGGLFELVTCPHYLFEIIAFFGFAMIAQTVFALAVAVGTVAYLASQSCATRRWYASKFEDFRRGPRLLCRMCSSDRVAGECALCLSSSEQIDHMIGERCGIAGLGSIE